MKQFVLSVLLMTAFFACKKEEVDEVAPTIVVEKPSEHANFHRGYSVQVEATFTDDQELATYAFKVGNREGEELPTLKHTDSGSLSGKSFVYEQVVSIPDTVEGRAFYLHFDVTDASGNSTQIKHMLHVH